MDARLAGYDTSKRPPLLPAGSRANIQAEARTQPAAIENPVKSALPHIASRPLSDIREITEPSLMDMTAPLSNGQMSRRRSASKSHLGPKKPSVPDYGLLQRSRSTSHSASEHHPYPVIASEACEQHLPHPRKLYDAQSSASDSTPEQSSCYAIPHSSVPRRSSSCARAYTPSRNYTRKPSVDSRPHRAPPPIPGPSIPNRGRSESPIKLAGSRLDPVTSELARRIPSRTERRDPRATDVADSPCIKHPRVKLECQVSAPIFVGGSTVEGLIRMVVDDNERSKARRTCGVGILSVDLLGVEEVPGNRRNIFLALGVNLIDRQRPPPPNAIQPANPLTPGDEFWTLLPSAFALPFVLTLPLDTGPPPFQSKHANIRFLLSATASIRDVGAHHRVRTTQEVHVLPTCDPESALRFLPTPLTARDQLILPKVGSSESIEVTAGLHRQVWVSGGTIFADVHIVNRSRKHIKRLDLALEQDILCYKHAPTALWQHLASDTRLFESRHEAVVASSTMKAGTRGWNGVEPHMTETRTCDLEVPRGHATVRCGKYFEVRFFLNVAVAITAHKILSLQLPVTLVHMNSLDVVPNSIAQVAAAMEAEKEALRLHARSVSRLRQQQQHPHRRRSTSSPTNDQLHRQRSCTAGQAFAAPLRQSLDRRRREEADIEDLRHALDVSPRKYHPPPATSSQFQGVALRKVGSAFSFGNVSLSGKTLRSKSPFRPITLRTPSSGTHIMPASGHLEALEAERVDSIRARMRKMASFDTPRGELSVPSQSAPWRQGHQQSMNPADRPPASSRIRRPSFEVSALLAGPSRPSTAMGSQHLDGKRFEVPRPVVDRKRSGSLKDRGNEWWEQVRPKRKEREREREGWI